MKIRLFVLFGVVLLFFSCEGKSKQAKMEEQKESNKAYGVIVYTNKVIDEANHIIGWLKTNDRNVTKLIELANKPELANDYSKKMHNSSFFLTDPGFYNLETNNNLHKISDMLEEADKVYFLENTEKYYFAKEGLRRMYKELRTYTGQEDYKDDNGKLGKLYGDSVKYYYTEMRNTINEMVYKAVDLGEEAELLTLGDSPIKQVVLLMREQIKMTEQLIGTYNAYKEGEASKEEIIELYTQYADRNSRNIKKSEDIKLVGTREKDFTSFMETNSEISGFFKIANRSLQAGESYSSAISSAEIYYEGLIKSYNRVIK